MDSTGSGGGLPLNTFNRNVPPGWRAGDPKYPLRLYRQLLQLWWRQTELTEAQTGPTLAGRLRGSALQFALALRRENISVLRGGGVLV